MADEAHCPDPVQMETEQDANAAEHAEASQQKYARRVVRALQALPAARRLLCFGHGPYHVLCVLVGCYGMQGASSLPA